VRPRNLQVISGAAARLLGYLANLDVHQQLPPTIQLSRLHLQPDADLSGIIFGEVNTGLLKSSLYFVDG
jgi:hypothetical protein